MESLFLSLSNPTLFARADITKPQRGKIYAFTVRPCDLNVTERLGIHRIVSRMVFLRDYEHLFRAIGNQYPDKIKTKRGGFLYR